MNKIYQGDAIDIMATRMGKHSVDIILTSPPYNTSRPKSKDKHNSRYDVYVDSKPDKEYLDWTLKVFEGYNKVLKPNGSLSKNLCSFLS